MDVQRGSTPVANWPAVWEASAARLRDHWAAGRGHLLTEDTFRLALVEALADHGVAASRLTAEVLAPGLGRGKLDLAVDGPTGTIVELKYPRDSQTGISPDTMTMGELLRDFCRVGVVGAADRWVAQVVNDRLARYLASFATRHGLRWASRPGGTMVLDRTVLEALPRTAAVAIGETPWLLPLTATCRARVAVVHGVTLLAYQVGPPDPGEARPLQARVTASPITTRTPVHRRPVSSRAATGARREILDAIDDLTAQSGRGTVTVAEVVRHLRARRSSYADSTIRTMMTAHMCVDSQGPGIGSYDDLERIGRGEYRRRHDREP